MAAYGKVELLAGRLRAANALGRSASLRLLFDFLVARSGDPAAPKEMEVASAIFGAGADFDSGQDASVRVYIHRLRQKLDDYYRADGKSEPERLSIPKGVGYRLVAEPNGEATAAPAPRTARAAAVPSRLRAWAIAAGITGLLLLNALAWVLVRHPFTSPDDFVTVRANPLWHDFIADHRSITLVVGDYYIFGETGGLTGDNRLVREYSINSPAELDDYLMHNPGMAGRYMDLGLFYLPTSVASALKSIMPVLVPDSATRDRIHVVQASDLTPDLIKRTDIIYVGYLSGLGLLRELVFAGSRFSVGDTYDELIDSVSHRHYESQEGGPEEDSGKLRDFGYFSTFTGPGGNHIMVIAGTRDVAVMQMAETATDPDGLAALARAAKSAPAYEALYEVEGIRRINVGSHLLLAAPLRTDRIWNASPGALRFPNG